MPDPLAICFRRLLLLGLGLALLGATIPARANTPAPAHDPEAVYRQVREFFHQTLLHSVEGHDRATWQRAVEGFRRLCRENPTHEVAPKSLFMLGNIHHTMYKRAGSPLDLGEAITYYEDLQARFPEHYLADDALFLLGHILRHDKQEPERAGRAFARLLALYPNGDMATRAEEELRALKGEAAPPPREIVADQVKKTITAKGAATPPPSLAQQLGLGIRRVVIDPGHGGKDPGAISPSGLQEKEVTLRVAKQLAEELRAKLGCEVILTRDRDVFVSLEERIAIANRREADLFISLHVNSAPNRAAKGLETYILDLATDQESMRVAAQENASSTRSFSDLQGILMDLMHNAKANESLKLAGTVQENMVSGLRQSHGEVKDLGVKKAPFIVLLGAKMPAVLVEIGFISNPQEEERLRSQPYLAQVARKIAGGVAEYAGTLSLAAASRR